MGWINRCRNLFRQEKLRAEFEEEIAFHLEKRAADLAGSANPELEARRRFGNLLRLREEMRGAKLIGWLDEFGQDLRYAVRLMRRSPALTLAAAGSLALALGANSAIFAVLDAAILKPLPVASPQQLVRLTFPRPGKTGPEAVDDKFSIPLFRQMREGAGSAANLFAAGTVRPAEVRFGGGPETEAIHLQHLSGEAFGVLGVNPVMGRTLSPQDDLSPGAHPVAVLSYGLWERLGRAPDVLGRRILLDGAPFEIVGVAQAGFSGTEVGNPADVWVPTMMWEPREGVLNNGWRNFSILGRLRNDAQPEQLANRLQPFFSAYLFEWVGRWPAGKPMPPIVREYLRSRLSVLSAARGTSAFRQEFTLSLWIVAAVAGMVLLVACGNIANLMLARAAARQREMAMRVSLGATRSRLLRQVLTESLALSLLATAGGVLLAIWGAPGLLRLLDRPEAPARLALTPDLRLLGFVLLACAFTTLSVGLVPALRVGLAQPENHLRKRVVPHGSISGRLLVLGQVSLSFVLVAASTLFVISLRNLLNSPAGFERGSLVLADIQVSGSEKDPARQRAAWEQVRLGVHDLHGVQNCAYSSWGLFSGFRRSAALMLPGSADHVVETLFLGISPGFFETLRTRILRGREFQPGDSERAIKPVIVNQTFARKWFGDTDPVGRTVELGPAGRVDVVGVAEDTLYNSLREPAPAMIYTPGEDFERMTLSIRTASTPAEIAAQLRQHLSVYGAGLRIGKVQAQTEAVENTLMRERLLARLSSVFAVVAVLLACLGVYGVLSYSVSQRTREIGVRAALGASRLHIGLGVFRHLSPAFALGLGLGALLTSALARFAEGIAFGLNASGPLPILCSGAVLLTVAIFAAAWPALRATRVDPATALRWE